jgi:hypothetical protein
MIKRKTNSHNIQLPGFFVFWQRLTTACKVRTRDACTSLVEEPLRKSRSTILTARGATNRIQVTRRSDPRRVHGIAHGHNRTISCARSTCMKASTPIHLLPWNSCTSDAIQVGKISRAGSAQETPDESRTCHTNHAQDLTRECRTILSQKDIA